MSADNVCAIIVTYNKIKDVTKLLEQLISQNNANLSDIIVIDNASNDGTSEGLKSRFNSLSNLTIITEKKNQGGSGGFIRGMNEALKKKADLFWLLDDDVVLQPDTLSMLLNAKEEVEGDWGALGSMIVDLDNPESVLEAGGGIYWGRGKIKCYYNKTHLEDVVLTPLRVECVAAASLLTNRKAVVDVGFFENLFIHFDDVEWCFRLNRNGFKVFSIPSSQVYHPNKVHTRPPWIRYYDARNILFFYRKHNPFLIFIPFIRYQMIAAVFCLRRDFLAAKFIWLGQVDFVKGRLRHREELVDKRL